MLADFLVNYDNRIIRQPGLSVDEEGHITHVEEWDDLRFAAVGLNPVGFASPPLIDADDGCLLFQNGQVNQIGIVAQLPHTWKIGTPLFPHVHWWKASSAAGTVIWQIRYRFSLRGQDASAYSSYVSGTESTTYPNANTAEHEARTDWGPIWVPATYSKESANMLITLQRLSSGAGADTFADNAKLVELDIHYAKSRLGTAER